MLKLKFIYANFIYSYLPLDQDAQRRPYQYAADVLTLRISPWLLSRTNIIFNRKLFQATIICLQYFEEKGFSLHTRSRKGNSVLWFYNYLSS